MAHAWKLPNKTAPTRPCAIKKVREGQAPTQACTPMASPFWGAGTNVRINCYLPTANCRNSTIDCSHNAGLRTVTVCQLSHRFHLVNDLTFVTHVFGLLPTFFARGCHSSVRLEVHRIIFFWDKKKTLTDGCHTISVQQTTLFAIFFHSLCADKLVEGVRDP